MISSHDASSGNREIVLIASSLAVLIMFTPFLGARKLITWNAALLFAEIIRVNFLDYLRVHRRRCLGFAVPEHLKEGKHDDLKVRYWHQLPPTPAASCFFVVPRTMLSIKRGCPTKAASERSAGLSSIRSMGSRVSASLIEM